MSIPHCRDLLRRYDYPRYLLSLTLSEAYRERFWVLGAVNVELSRAAEMNEPATRAIRLKWWQEALLQPRQHPIVEAWHRIRTAEAEAAFLRAIDAREVEIDGAEWFADIKALDNYATDTGGFWAGITSENHEAAWLTSLGQLYALQGLLWATGYHLQQSRLTLPRQVCDAHAIDPLGETHSEDAQKLAHIISTLADRTDRSLQMLLDKTEDFAHLPLARAVNLIRWRCDLMQQSPQLALSSNPPEKRLAMLWQVFGKRV